MSDALPRMPGNDESNQPVTLVVQQSLLILRGRSRYDWEWTEIPVPNVTVTGPEQQVCLNRCFVIKALRFGLAEIEVRDSFSPVLFTGPGKQLFAMPMRLDAPPATAQPQPEPSPQEATRPTEATEPVPPSTGQPDNPTEQNTTNGNKQHHRTARSGARQPKAHERRHGYRVQSRRRPD
jgi:hypothetical protein